MTKLGRLLFVGLLLLGFFIAWQRLREQNVPLQDVIWTGLLFIAGLLGLFAVLLGLGKLLSKLTPDDDP